MKGWQSLSIYFKEVCCVSGDLEMFFKVTSKSSLCIIQPEKTANKIPQIRDI